MNVVSNKKNEKLLEKLLLLLTCYALINVFCYYNTQIENFCMIAFLGILLFIALYWQLLSKKFFFMLFFFCYLSIFLTITQHGGEGIAINFFNVLLAILVFCNSKIRLATFRRIHLVTAIFLSIYMFTMDYEGVGLIYIHSLLGFQINKNSLGFLILANFYNWMCFLSTYKNYKVLRWLIEMIICAVCGYLLNLTGCRTAIGAMVIFLLLSVVKRTEFSYRQLRWITILVMLMNIVIVPIYISVAEKSADIMLLGKTLFSGREYVWQSAWKHFLRSPWIGNGAEVAFAGPNRTISASAHNTILNIMCTLGVLPAASFVFLLGRRLVSTIDYPYNRVAQFAFLSSLLLSLFESFYIDSHFVVFYLILLLPVEAEQEVLT